MVLPEYYFPTRAVMNIMASKFKYNSDDNIITNTDLQYLMPHMHTQLLSVIIDTYIYGKITKKIKNSTAIYLQSDASVYRTHVDKIYTLAKLIDTFGNVSIIFLSRRSFECGDREIFNTIIKSMENLLESNVINLIMKEVSSFVTGGIYVNTGHFVFIEYISRL